MIFLVLATLVCGQLPPIAVEAEKECGESCERELAEKFANGDGVPRDYDIAAAFLCRAEPGMAQAEYDGMSAHLEKMRKGETEAPLRFCDHVTSGYGSTYCASVRWDEEMPKLDARINALRGRPLMNELLMRGAAFAAAETEFIGEQSQGGTGYSAILLATEIDEKERFIASVEQWSKERAPSASSAEAKSADAELNAMYRKTMKDTEDPEWRSRLRKAQRAWILYRDAFAAFYVDRWRDSAPADVLRREIVTQLTSDRTKALTP